MSTIERLSIQGIRSFGGNAGDAQVHTNEAFLLYSHILMKT